MRPDMLFPAFTFASVAIELFVVGAILFAVPASASYTCSLYFKGMQSQENPPRKYDVVGEAEIQTEGNLKKWKMNDGNEEFMCGGHVAKNGAVHLKLSPTAGDDLAYYYRLGASDHQVYIFKIKDEGSCDFSDGTMPIWNKFDKFNVLSSKDI
jgi:hypothetical protein